MRLPRPKTRIKRTFAEIQVTAHRLFGVTVHNPSD